MKELDLDGLARHEFELQHGVFLINPSHGQLDSVPELRSLGQEGGREWAGWWADGGVVGVRRLGL